MGLGQRAFDVLHALIERRERLVTKNELLDIVWRGVVVEENNLQVQISALRKLLGPQVIATIPGRGYRFTAALDGAADVGQTPAMAIPVPAAMPSSPPVAPQTNLPTELPVLYGRDSDLAALCTLIDAHGLVTVVGAGGIGKSRLAQAVAHAQVGRWPDGAWMVELAGLSDPALLPNAVAQVLHITLTGQGDALEALVVGMARRTALLVLDNCEHMLDAVAALVQAVQKNAPSVRLLATSQEPLHLPAEQQFRVLPLAVPTATTADHWREFGAVALFEARVRAVDPRFALTDESLPLAVDICRRLDGLPLAIEMAAARVATLGLRPVRDKLDARFKLLTGGSRATLRRHQTLRAALEWSHQLLNDAEQAVFRRLGVFAGGFTMGMAQALASDAQLDEWAVLDHLSALVDKSLVVADAGEAPRYRLLESARAFALEQLALAKPPTCCGGTRGSSSTSCGGSTARTSTANCAPTSSLGCCCRNSTTCARPTRGRRVTAVTSRWLSVSPRMRAPSSTTRSSARTGLRPTPGVASIAMALDTALAARYWRAIAANNMVGHVPRALQLEAAARARARCTPRSDLPRRTFTCLIQISRHAMAMRQDAIADRQRSTKRGNSSRPTGPRSFASICCAATPRLPATPAVTRRRFRACAKLPASVRPPEIGGSKSSTAATWSMSSGNSGRSRKRPARSAVSSRSCARNLRPTAT